MVHQKVMIVVPRKAIPATSQFDLYFDQIEKPEDVVIGITKIVGQSPARNRNEGIRQALENNFTHVLFIDDDVLVPKDIISRLLAHNKDIVTGLYLMRNYPHRAIAFDYQQEDGFSRWLGLSPNKDGLVQIESTGLGCCLVNTQIFMKMEAVQPGQKLNGTYHWIRLGEVESDHWCDDLGFFNRVKKLGYRIYLDTNVRCGHMAEIAVWPDKMNDKWVTVYDSVGGEGTAAIPQFFFDEETELSGIK